MSDQINLVEAFGIMVEHYDTYAKQLGMATIKAFVNADAIKILFDNGDDTCTLEAYCLEELKGSFSVDYYELTDYIAAILQNVNEEYTETTLERTLEECLSDYGLTDLMDFLLLGNVWIEIDNETIITFVFKDPASADRVSIIIPTDIGSISRSNVASAIHSC